MDAKERETVSGIIRAKISELEGLTNDIASTRQLLTDQPKDNDARIEILAHASVDEATHLQMKRELELLRDNLAWLQDKHGGQCAECGQAIPVGRLTIVPTTRLCVTCSSQQEGNN